MKPRPDRSPSFRRLLMLLLTISSAGLLFLDSRQQTSAQSQVQVTAADPSAGEQGTVGLNVRVGGKGFKSGMQAKWVVTGTSDTGGVTVNSTTFVSTTEVVANISIADTAVITNFDIQVLASDGRGGKGTELFAVTAKTGGNAACPAMQPAPATDTKCYDVLSGCLDSSFGNSGLVHLHLGDPTYSESAYAMVAQPDGKIVIAGAARTTATSIDFAVSRFNPDGSLDTSFGDADLANPPFRRGYTITAVTAGSDVANAMALQSDGKIVVLGSANSTDSAVVRYNVDGTLDTTFGSRGIALPKFGKRTGAPNRDLALQIDGKILIAGTVGNGFGVARLLANGSVDTSFGSSGLVIANPSGTSSGTALAFSIAIQRVPALTGEERIVVGGSSSTSSSASSVWTLMRFKPNGLTDTSFGSAGIVKTPFFGYGDTIHEISIDVNNRIIAAGEVYTASRDFCGTYTLDVGIVRYTADGSIDGSFGGGTQTIDIYGGADHVYGLAVQPDGKILVSGYSFSSDLSVKTFALVRLNVSGDLDQSFGLMATGVVTTNLYGFTNYANALALLPSDGRIVLAGNANLAAGGPSDVVIARYRP